MKNNISGEFKKERKGRTEKLNIKKHEPFIDSPFPFNNKYSDNM
jgi:hypothetical protein